MNSTTLYTFALLTALLIPALAFGDTPEATTSAATPSAETPSAQAILEQVDQALTVADDFTATIELVTTSASGSTEERTMDVWQKGEKRMVKLTAPSRLRGVGLLAKSDDQLYLYLPSFGRVRRVAGQQRGESFMGSNFTQDDIARTNFSSRFNPEYVDQNDTHWNLRLRPSDEDEPYTHLLIEVRKEDHQVSTILFFEEGSEEAVRRLTASDFKVIESQSLAHTVVVEELRTKSRSVATLSDVEVNAGLSDSIFTRRYLQR